MGQDVLGQWVAAIHPWMRRGRPIRGLTYPRLEKIYPISVNLFSWRLVLSRAPGDPFETLLPYSHLDYASHRYFCAVQVYLAAGSGWVLLG